MIWWFRVRMGTAVLIALIVMMTFGAAASSATVPVPVILGGVTVALPVPFLLPILPVIITVFGQARGNDGTERTTARPLVLWDSTAVVLLVTGAAFVGLCQWWWTSWSMGPAMARNFAGYLGLALLLRWLAGPAVALLATSVFPFFCASFGIVPGHDPKIWHGPFTNPAPSLGSSVSRCCCWLASLLRHSRGPVCSRSLSFSRSQ